MTNLQCDSWFIEADGTIKCLGSAAETSGLFPPLTLTEANLLIATVVGLFATVYILRTLRKLF